MNFDEKKLRTFLCSAPKPARILVHVDDAEAREIVVPATGKTWAHIAQSIVALGDVKVVECYDANGALLRATRGEEDDRRAQETKNIALGVPTHADPETARLIHFSNLLFRATEFSINKSFDKMVELYTLQNERMVAIESRLERTEGAYRKTVEERLRDAFEEAEAIARSHENEPPANPLTGMLEAFMHGANARNAPHDTVIPPPPPARRNGSNGKHPHPPESEAP